MERTFRSITYLSATVLIIISALLIVNIISPVQFRWIPEITRILNIGMVFIMIGAVARIRQHIQINYFFKKLPSTAQKYGNISIIILNIFVLVVIGISALIAMIESIDGATQTTKLPISIYYIGIIPGILTLSYLYFRELAEEVTN